MTAFRTILPFPKDAVPVGYDDGMLAMGSCFAAHMGSRLAERKFRVALNPFGIVYNPLSLADGIALLSGEALIEEGALFEHQGLWHSFRHHGSFSHPDKLMALAQMNGSLTATRAFLPRCTRLLLTLGSAFAYVYRGDGAVVANCHKVPGNSFDKRLVGVDEAVRSLSESLDRLKAAVPGLEVILSVSPVRHLRDGIVENQRSKAVLLLAAEALCSSLSYVHYFPAYELLMDDLRDYRFYEADMAHPNGLAVSYIWDYFSAAHFSPATRAIVQEVAQLQAAVQHRPVHPHTAQHRAFVGQQLERIRKLEAAHPFLQFEAEKAVLESQLG